MATAKLYNRVKVATATTGTGTVTLGAASSNAFCTFAEAGAANSDVVTYCIEESTDFEIGRGTYTSAGTTLSRTTVLLSKIAGTAGTTKMNLAGAATVRIVEAKEDTDVSDFTAETAPAVDDTIWLYDLSATAKRAMQLQNVLAVINALTADSTPDATADYIVTYDASASAAKKALLANIPGSATRRAITGGDTVVAGDRGNLVEITSGTFTLAFTAAATLANGFTCFIYNSGTGTVTLDPNGAEQIDGLTTWKLYPGGAIMVICTGSAFESVLLAPMRIQYDANDTFTKPGVGTYAEVWGWGAGGSGGKGTANSPEGGGGGGACVVAKLLLSAFGTTETITIGGGGAAQTTASTAGSVGGNTTVGSLVTAYGGGAGGNNIAGGAGGGGGGSQAVGANAGALATPGGAGGGPVGGVGGTTGPTDAGGSAFGGGGGGAGVTSGTAGKGGASGYGGGGGGAGCDGAGSASLNPGGNSVYGGGGGGGAADSSAGGSGGTSTFGGNGSAGAIDANTSSDGTQPGGGSGGTEGGNSGKGGDGRVIIYVY